MDDRWQGRAGASRDHRRTLEMSGAELRENIVLENRNLTISCFSACLRGLCGRARAPGFLKDWLDSGAVAFAPGLCGRFEMRSALARWVFVRAQWSSSIGAGHTLNERPASTASPTGRADLGASPGQAQICQDLSLVAMRLHPRRARAARDTKNKWSPPWWTQAGRECSESNLGRPREFCLPGSTGTSPM